MTDASSIVVLNDFCHAEGGASRVAIDEAVALRRRGLNVTFLGAVGPVCAELRDADVRVVCLGQPALAEAGSHPAAALRAIWNRPAARALSAVLAPLSRERTIVHLHGYTKALSAAPVRAARGAGFTVICTLHDFFTACPNGAFFDYRRAVPCTLRPLSLPCALRACDKRHPAHKAYRLLRGVVQRDLLRFPAIVDEYITLSRRSVRVLAPFLPAHARLHALPNIIDVPRASPVDPGANAALVVVGRLDAEKGGLLAARAAAQAGLPITFVGDGPLRAQLEEAGARVTGWLDAAGVRGELAQARCLVFPSLWYEAFGLVVAEAAARGVPAIVSDVSAAAERVVDDRNGWIFPSGDVAALAERMALTRDDAVLRAAGAAAYDDYWSDPADPDRHAAALLAIYAAALAGRVPAAA